MSAPDSTLPRRQFLARVIAAVTTGAWLGSRPRKAEAAPLEAPYVGEIRMFAGNFAPEGWMFCEGQTLPIAEYDSLFQLIGTGYGGDGKTTFALPDLRSRAPMHAGNGYTLGEPGGVETVFLSVSQMPAHSHTAFAGSGVGTSDDPTGRLPARNAAGVPQYGPAVNTDLSPNALLTSGGNQVHNNMQPYIPIHYIISLFGIYPTPQ